LADDRRRKISVRARRAILCTGIIVLDKVFRVEELPQPDGKVEAKDFFIVNGGCAANAAVAVARLGGRAALAGPLGGPAGEDGNGDLVLAALARETVDCSACQRIDGLATGLSAIFIDGSGDRTIVTYRDQRIAAVTPADPEASPPPPTSCSPITDIRNSCGRSARRRGAASCASCSTPTRRPSKTMCCFASLRMSSFPRSACGQRPAAAIWPKGLTAIARQTDAFLAVSNGPNDILFLEAGALRRVPVFAIRAVDTLGAGDALHGGFALALAEGQSEAEALRFGAAVAGIKCTRIGGSAGAPRRAEVEAFLAERASVIPERRRSRGPGIHNHEE
jgi:sulfofructose kinase